jgi:hypothetical protein
VPLDANGATPEKGDQFTLLVADFDVVDAAAASLLSGVPHSGENVAEMGRGDEVDVHAAGDGAVVVAIAGVGEGRIGDGEDEAAVAGAVLLTMSRRTSCAMALWATATISMPRPRAAWSSAT